MTVVDTDKLIDLLRKNPNGSEKLSSQIGVSKQLLITLRNGKKDVESLTLRKAILIQNYLERNERK